MKRTNEGALTLGKMSLWKKVKHDRGYFLLCAPAIVLVFIFSYIPMYGIYLAFTDFSIRAGILGSPFVGFKWFERFFTSVYFFRVLKNTVLLSTLTIVFTFPLPVAFALLLREVQNKAVRKAVQTISYMPHFISTVIVVGIMMNLFSPSGGIINRILTAFNLTDTPINFFYQAKYFRMLYIGSEIWQHFGWNSIIYIATILSIDPQLYEAAEMDGAGKWKQMLHVTLPGIRDVTVTLLILAFGSVMSVGFEKVLLMYNPATWETSDVIATYTYREGILGSLGYGSAVGIFNSIINLILLIIFNSIARRVSEVSLW